MSKETENDLNKKLDRIYQEMQESGVIEEAKKLKVALDVKYRNESNNEAPAYKSDGASGFDIRAYVEEAVTLQPFQRKLIHTGLYFELPTGYELQVRPRSGLALKHGVTVLNTPGTVDCDYRGEVGIILINLGQESFTIENGDRIAQGVIQHSLGGRFYNLVEVTEKLSETERGEGGFGSSGIK